MSNGEFIMTESSDMPFSAHGQYIFDRNTDKCSLGDCVIFRLMEFAKSLLPHAHVWMCCNLLRWCIMCLVKVVIKAES